MERYAVDKLEVSLWGLSMNAQGTTAIAAAFVIAVLLVSLRFRK
jgi:preprotein translocase subunit SecF